MINIGDMPQRIGHKVFPHSVLEAQAQLMIVYPQLFPPRA